VQESPGRGKRARCAAEDRYQLSVLSFKSSVKRKNIEGLKNLRACPEDSLGQMRRTKVGGRASGCAVGARIIALSAAQRRGAPSSSRRTKPTSLVAAYNDNQMLDAVLQPIVKILARFSIPEPRLRSFFRWKYSGVLIPVFLSAGLSMIGIGQGLDPPGAAFSLVFGLAYFFLIATLIWSMGYWQTSDFLRKRNPEFWSNKKKKRKGASATRKFHWLQRGASALVLIFFAGFVFLTALIRKEKELSSLHGILIPARDALPPNPCLRVPENALLIYMGFATSWVTQFPHTIIEVDGTPRLIV